MKTVLRSSNLNCPSCVARLEKALKMLDGVEGAHVSFTTGRIEVEYDGARIGTEELVTAIRKAGYEAKVSAF